MLAPEANAHHAKSFAKALGDEVLGLRVVADDGVGGLFGMQLKSFRDLYANSPTFKQVDQLGIIGQIGTGWVSPRVATTAVFLAEQASDGRTIFGLVAKFCPDSAMPKFGQPLSHLDT
jgi:hypothetical protein